MFAWAPTEIWFVAVAALIYGAYVIMTIVRGIAIPEMISKEAYGAINGALVVPITLSKAFAPLAAAALWSATGSYATTMTAMVMMAVVTVLTFWAAAVLSRRRQ